jgi:N-acetyl-anhydromuramyl-L-alanine amidase AmpD
MAGSRVPGALSEKTSPGLVDDGTSARVAMPGAGAVGQTSHRALAPNERLREGSAASQEAVVDQNGLLRDLRVRPKISSTIERGEMAAIHGIIVHQTDSMTAQSTLDSYKKAGANGAHFLIDKDGTIYQTASLHRQTWHVGKLKARCLVEKSCSPTDIKAYRRFDPPGMHARESVKVVPQRYPSNVDSIGIELVGKALPVDPKQPDGPSVYEVVTDAQNESLKWLIDNLTHLLGVPMTEVFRHPDASWKNLSEASTAKWR